MDKNKTNKELRRLYDGVYKKGEQKHYTRLFFAKGRITNDKIAVLKEIEWRGKKVIDVGCGTGELPFRIARRGAKEVLGIDYSPEAIDVAVGTYTHANLSFKVMPLEKIKGAFDVVTSLGTLEHTNDPLSTLRLFKKHLNPGGSIIVTCPNWVNPRGYMLQLLLFLFNARITLADLQYLTPVEFEAWAKKLKMDLTWRTVDHDWGHGDFLIEDFKRRLPNVLRELPVSVSNSQIDSFIEWLKTHMVPFEKNTRSGGVTGVYHFRKN